MEVNNLFSGTDSNPSGSRPTVSLVAECIAADVSVYKLCLWFYVGFNDSQGETGHFQEAMMCRNLSVFEFLFL